MHNKKDIYRYPYRDSNTLEGSKRLKDREKDSKTKGKIYFWAQSIAIYIRQTKPMLASLTRLVKPYSTWTIIIELYIYIKTKTVGILKTALYTLIISLGPGFSDRFSMGSESAIVFSVVLIQKNEIKMTNKLSN